MTRKKKKRCEESNRRNRKSSNFETGRCRYSRLALPMARTGELRTARRQSRFYSKSLPLCRWRESTDDVTRRRYKTSILLSLYLCIRLSYVCPVEVDVGDVVSVRVDQS